MSFSFFIYYEVTAINAERMRHAADELLKAIFVATGIQGRLLCRRDKTETWMEVYEGVAGVAPFQAILDTEVKRLSFAALLAPESKRITELFRPL